MDTRNFFMLVVFLTGSVSILYGMDGGSSDDDSDRAQVGSRNGSGGGNEQEDDDEVVVGIRPMPIQEALRRFASGSRELVEAKRKVCEYYQSGAFDREVFDTVVEPLLARLLPQAGPRQVVVLSADEVLISNFALAHMYSFEPIPNADAFYQYRLQGTCPAIQPMWDLGKELNKRGYELVLLCARRSWKEGLYAATLKNLSQPDRFAFAKLVLAPDECNWEKHGEETMSIGAWKARERQTLVEQGYTVVATVGNRDDDFEGGRTGLKIRVPDYLCWCKDSGDKNYLKP